MKPILAACLCAALLLSLTSYAQGGDKSHGKEKSADMKGAYDMLSQKVTVDGKDSLFNEKQFKIYTDRHFMYAHNLPNDSLGAFGIGTYRMQNGKVIEYPFYTSAQGSVKDTIELAINKTADGYSQIINFPPDSQGRAFILTEDYRNASRNASTPLDGAWKMTRVAVYPKSGAPEVVNDPIQYKIFQSGHVMWANSRLDSATQKHVTAYGYGTVTMNGPNQAVESMTRSTYRTMLEGQSITLQLTFKGKDHYQQTIVLPDGGKLVEDYERLK